MVSILLSFTAELKKKNTKPKRPTIKTLFEEESDTPDADASETSQGSFLNHLPPQRAFSEKRKEHAIEKRKESA